VLTVLVGLALPTVPAWVIWQVVKLLKGPSVPVSPEEEKRLRDIAQEAENDLILHDPATSPIYESLLGNIWHNDEDD